MIVEIAAVAGTIKRIATGIKGSGKAAGYVGVPGLFGRWRHGALNGLAGELILIKRKDFAFRYLGVSAILEVGAIAGLVRAMAQALVDGREPIVANARRRWSRTLIRLCTTLLAYRVEILLITKKIAPCGCQWQGIGLRIFVPIARRFGTTESEVVAYL